MMYGDKEGNIAWWASAKLPVRPEGVDTKVALDGTDPNLDVTAWHGFDLNPKSVNPASGFVCSANNAPASNDSIDIPGHYYSGNTRAGAIMAALSTPKNDWTLDDAQAIQLDHHSPVYASNARMLVAFADQAGADVDVLRGWDGSHLSEDIAPTVYYRWMYRTIQGAMLDEFEKPQAKCGLRKNLRLAQNHRQRKRLPQAFGQPKSLGGTMSAQKLLKRHLTSWPAHGRPHKKTASVRWGTTLRSGNTDACMPSFTSMR